MKRTLLGTSLEYTPYAMADIVERMIALNTVNTPVDYGTGEAYNAVEVHTLSYIADYPGISASEIAYNWNRSKGAVSQIIKKLNHRELIYRKKKTGNDKNICLFVTEKGAELDRVHREYDTRNYERFLKVLGNYFSKDEIYKMFQIMEVWAELSKDWVPQ